jgi:hypothetical protein
MPALFNQITSQYSSYELVTGDHLGMVSSSATPIDDWLFSLGL